MEMWRKKHDFDSGFHLCNFLSCVLCHSCPVSLPSLFLIYSFIFAAYSMNVYIKKRNSTNCPKETKKNTFIKLFSIYFDRTKWVFSCIKRT